MAIHYCLRTLQESPTTNKSTASATQNNLAVGLSPHFIVPRVARSLNQFTLVKFSLRCSHWVILWRTNEKINSPISNCSNVQFETSTDRSVSSFDWF